MTRRALVATALAASALGLVLSTAAVAAEETYAVTIKDGHFEPATLDVKAKVKFKLTVKNEGTAAVEFESHELKREKVVAPGASVVINMGPLEPGTYAFMDDFNPAAKGQIVAK